jgi:murein DD-endopeptidase MepM/ murein hydrolase activator NlpD
LTRIALLKYLVLLSAALGLLWALVHWAGEWGLMAEPTPIRLDAIYVTARPPLPGTPVALFAPVDAALAGYLAQTSGRSVINADVPPLGAYLPGGTPRFALPTVTPSPTLTPTMTPSPPATTTAIPPTLTPTPSITPSITPYPTSVSIDPLVYPTSPPVPPFRYPEDAEGPFIDCAPVGMPVSGLLTQHFHSGHGGIDISLPNGTPLMVTHSGVVTYAQFSPVGYGNLVIVQNGPFITYYAHQSTLNVRAGEFVVQGSVIGWSGNTGNSSGPHLHYETRINDVPVDPLTFENRRFPGC